MEYWNVGITLCFEGKTEEEVLALRNKLLEFAESKLRDQGLYEIFTTEPYNADKEEGVDAPAETSVKVKA